MPDAPAHEVKLYALAEHSGFQLDVPVNRVGIGGEYDYRLFGPVAAFGALEATMGRDAGAPSYTPDITAKGGFKVTF